MSFLLFFFVMCFGLILGSFFNVLIWRLPRGESIVSPPSHCPNCGYQIAPWQNIPVLSYIALRGRCASCKVTISPIYPLLEILTGGVAVLFWYLLTGNAIPGQWYSFTFLCIQMLTLLLIIPIAFIDFKHFIIPDQISLTLIVLGIAASFLPGNTTPLQSLLGIVAGGGSLFVIGWLGTVVFKKGDAMGGGDIKLMAGIGAVWGAQTALLSIMFGSFFGAFAGVFLLSLRKIKNDHHIPFGPYLGIGFWIAATFGSKLLKMYLDWSANFLIR